LRVVNIRLAAEADRDAIWNIFHAVVSAGDTYAFDPRISREDALAYWFGRDTRTYVAKQDRQSVGEAVGFVRAGLAHGTAAPSPTVEAHQREVVGTYILRPNQSGDGSHVANAAFMVAPGARALGVGRKMGEHCLSEARRLGFVRCNSILSFRQTHPRSIFGNNSGSRSPALYRAHFAILKRDMSMFM
jgi:GNAT superfamily N-acetyltransferase